MYSDLDNFEVISTIRTGSYGPSKKVRSKKDDKIMVLKEVEYTTMTESEKRVLLSEVNLLRDLCFKNYILHHYNRIIDRSRPVIHYITEYCEGGDLEKIIVKNRNEGTQIPQQFIWKIFVQMTLALKECHKQELPVLHRDLKPANVFLDAEYNVRLGDFVLAQVKTPYYMSPEHIKNQPHDAKTDIWSLGCLVYELCALVPPFTASNQSELNRKILTGDFPRIPSRYSSDLDKIIRDIIQVKACNRTSIKDILFRSQVKRTLDCPDCEHADRRKQTRCFLNSLANESSRHGKPRYEDILAKERKFEIEEIERWKKRVASRASQDVYLSELQTMTPAVEEFAFISTIRTGSFGPSKKVRRKKDGKIMVLKVVEYTNKIEKQVLLAEVNLLVGLHGDFIVKYSSRIIDWLRPVIYIVMEYCEGGDLEKIIVKNREAGTHIPQQFIWKILFQIGYALKDCHQLKTPVLHRDLKPANVFLDAEYNVKLGDFGLARVKTPYYMSPELINDQPYDEKTDIWSLGCLMYELCALVPPFTASNQSELNRKILTGDFPRIPSQYSSDLDKTIREFIQVEACKRRKIQDILLRSQMLRMLDGPDCEHDDSRTESICFLNSMLNGSCCHGKPRYEDTLAQERQLEEKQRMEKHVASKKSQAEYLFELTKMPSLCTSDCQDVAELGTRTADMFKMLASWE